MHRFSINNVQERQVQGGVVCPCLKGFRFGCQFIALQQILAFEISLTTICLNRKGRGACRLSHVLRFFCLQVYQCHCDASEMHRHKGAPGGARQQKCVGAVIQLPWQPFAMYFVRGSKGWVQSRIVQELA